MELGICLTLRSYKAARPAKSSQKSNSLASDTPASFMSFSTRLRASA